MNYTIEFEGRFDNGHDFYEGCEEVSLTISNHELSNENIVEIVSVATTRQKVARMGGAWVCRVHSYSFSFA